VRIQWQDGLEGKADCRAFLAAFHLALDTSVVGARIHSARQQPLQMLLIFLSTCLSCLSVIGSPVPVATEPPDADPPDGTAVPAELVPGEAALDPSEPPPPDAPPGRATRRLRQRRYRRKQLCGDGDGNQKFHINAPKAPKLFS
jgi:hypothetical protein